MNPVKVSRLELVLNHNQRFGKGETKVPEAMRTAQGRGNYLSIRSPDNLGKEK